MDRSEDSQSGVEEGARAVVGSETLGDVTVTEEREDIVKARKISASVAGTSRMRSRNYNDRRRQSSTLLGKHLAVAAFGLWLISLLALRFITCLDSLRLHKAGSRGVFPSVRSRKLAEGQDDRLPLVPAGDSDSEDGQSEIILAGLEDDEAARCSVIIQVFLSKSDSTTGEHEPSTSSEEEEEETLARPTESDTASGQVALVLKGPTEAENESSKLVSKSHLREWLSRLQPWVPLAAITTLLFVAGLICIIVGAVTNGGDDVALKIAASLLWGIGAVTFAGAFIRRHRSRTRNA